MYTKVFTGTLAVMLSACSTQNGDLELSSSPNFGEAHRYNVAVQTIDPAPVYGPDGAQAGDHGGRAAEAIERYRTGAVKEVEVIETSEGTSGTAK